MVIGQQNYPAQGFPYYVGQSDAPKLLSALLDAAREELISRDEARAWLAAACPQFKAVIAAKCCPNCPR